MKKFTTNMAVQKSIKHNKKSEQKNEEELSEDTKHKLKLIEKAFK
jgi:hypothetical protein